MDENFYIPAISKHEESFETLASLFNSKPVNNILKIPPEKGQGIVRKFMAADGLYIISWDIQLEETNYLERMAQESRKKSSNLFYVFTGSSFSIFRNTGLPVMKEALKNIVFASGEIDLRFVIRPSAAVRVIEIIISDEWLASDYVSNNLSSYSFYTALMNKEKPLLFTEQASLSVHHSFHNVYSHVNNSNPDSAYARAKMLSLLSDIFISFGRRHDIIYRKSIMAEEKMIGIEKIMDDHLVKSLPPICDIAKQFALSESTLKRMFKTLYGTSIYEYYLQKKMQKAMQLFGEGHASVKEVAYMLGYEKVSNFITIFKKYYITSPGVIKKSLAARSSLSPKP